MKALVLLGALFVAPFFVASTTAPEGRWHDDLAAAQKLALDTGQPMLVAFR